MLSLHILKNRGTILRCVKKILDKSSAHRNTFIKWQWIANYHLQEAHIMPIKIHTHEAQFESLDPDEIILDGDGKYPKKVTIRFRRGDTKEYRIIRTQLGGFALNK